MLNLYDKLGISLDASAAEIKAAITQAAQTESLPLEVLQKANQWLLNEQVRKQYNAKLFAEHPEILQEMFAAARANTQAPAPNEPPPRKIKRVNDDDEPEAQISETPHSDAAKRIAKATWRGLKHYSATRHQRVGSGCLSTALGVFFGGLMLIMLPIILLFGSCSVDDTYRKRAKARAEAAAQKQEPAYSPPAAPNPQQIGTNFVQQYTTGGDGSALDPYVITARSLARAFADNPDAATTGLSGKNTTLIGRVGFTERSGYKVYLLGDGDSANVHVDMSVSSTADSGTTIMFGDCRVSGWNGSQISVYGCVQLKP